MRAIMSEPSGSWNGSDGRFCCAARSAWIIASAVQSRTGSALALRGGAEARRQAENVEAGKADVDFGDRLRLEQDLERQPAGPRDVAQVPDAAPRRWPAAGRSAAGRNDGRRRRSGRRPPTIAARPGEIGEDAAGSA